MFGGSRCVRALGLLVALSAASPRAAVAGGFAIPEIGARKTGMGAVVGRPDELDAVYHNPAGLTLLPGTWLSISIGASLPSSDFRLRPWPGSEKFIDAPVSSDGYYPETQPTRAFGVIPFIAASTNLLSDRLWIAASLYVPNAQGGSFDPNGVTRFHLVDSYAVAGYGTLSLAWRVNDRLSIGAGLSLIYVRAYADRRLFPILAGHDLTAFLGKNADLTLDGSGLDVGWNAGVLLWPTSSLSIGAAVIGGNHLDVKGGVTVTPSDDGFLSGNPFSGTQTTGIVIPWTLLLGANLDVSRHVEIGAELRYWYYAEFQNQHTSVEGIDLLKSLDSPKNYDNSWQVSGGVRVHDLPAGLELMAGMHYDRSPAPDDTVSLDSPSFNHVGLHVGARYTIRERWRLALTYAHYWYLERSTDASLTTPPSNFEASGQNNIVTLAIEVMLGPGLVLKR